MKPASLCLEQDDVAPVNADAVGATVSPSLGQAQACAPTMAPTPASWVPVLVISAGSILASLDLFVVNLAFSSIGKSFSGTSMGVLGWIVSGYAVTFAAFLVPAGQLADQYGRRRVFGIGLLVFSLASALCGLAPDAGALIVGRAVQGLGAALMVPTSLGLLLHAYPSRLHSRMLGIWVASGSLAASLGPVFGGLLVAADWRRIFYINLPVSVLALSFLRYVPETQARPGRLPDLAGSLALLAAIATLIMAITFLGDPTQSVKHGLSLLLAAIGLTGVFIWRCQRASVPALDLSVFRSWVFSVATIGMLAFYIGFAMLLLGCMLFVLKVWHWSAIHAGLGFAVGPATAAITSVSVGQWRVPPRRLALMGGVLFAAAGIWWWWRLGDTAQYVWDYLPGLILSGMAAGSAQTGLLAGGTSALSAERYATGAGVLNTARQIGAGVGASIFVAVVGLGTSANAYKANWLALMVFGAITALAALYLPRATANMAASVTGVGEG